MKKNLLILLFGLMPLLLTTSCKDDKNDLKNLKKVEIVNGNVVLTETETESGVTITVVTLFVYEDGIFNHMEQKFHCPNPNSALAAYQTLQDYINSGGEDAEYIEDLSIKGNTVTIVYTREYRNFDAPFENISDMSAQELKNFLQSLIDNNKGGFL